MLGNRADIRPDLGYDSNNQSKRPLAVDSNSLIGKTLERVWLFPAAPIHPAWVNALTTPINTCEAFLEFSDGELASLSPCEVNLSEKRYPSLGLAIEASTSAAMKMTYSDGQGVSAVLLEEANDFLPAPINFIDASDPLGQDTATQYDIGGDGWRITFRHIFPPMTLGICVERR